MCLDYIQNDVMDKDQPTLYNNNFFLIYINERVI